MTADNSFNSSVNEIAMIICQLVQVSEKYAVKVTLLNMITVLTKKINGVNCPKVT